MPFGLCNAPATFQAIIDHILHDLLAEGVVIYIDDILIYSQTQKEHEILVQEVLAWVDKAGLGVNLRKSYFHTSVIEFLGYIISADGIKMTERKVQEVQNWPLPRKVKDIHEFLGFANFYRRFIKGFSKTAYALTELTKKYHQWN